MILKTENQIKVVLAESNPMILSAMSEEFSSDPRISLISTVKNSEDFLSTVLRVPVDLGIVCWSLPKLGGEKIIEVLRENPSAPKILVYARNHTPDIARRALAAGAAGFCNDEQTVDELLETAITVAGGKMVFPFMDVRELQADPLFMLTKRERVILQFLADGSSNKELAERLGISINTVKFHLSNLYEKLGVKNRSQAISFFYSRRLDQHHESDGSEKLLSR
jgi:two-component system nitrate/nitrite response regulator NarP